MRLCHSSLRRALLALALSGDGRWLILSDFLDRHLRVLSVPTYKELASGPRPTLAGVQRRLVKSEIAKNRYLESTARPVRTTRPIADELSDERRALTPDQTQ